MNIRVDLDTTIMDGMGVVFRSPVDCSQITGLIVYYQENGNTSSKEFVFSDAHGYNVGDIDHLFAENAVVKVILDVTTGMAFVQNADTNAYLEDRFEDIENMISAGGGGSVKSAVLYIPQTLTEEQKAQVRSNIGAMGIYLGSGDMPENCNVQIDPDGDVFGDVLLYTKQTLTEEQKAQARANIGAADDALFDKTYLANNILNPANSESGYYDTALTKMPSAKHMRTITPIPVEPNSYLYLNTTFVTADTSIIVCVMQLNGDGEYVSQISRKFLDLEPVQIGSNTSWVHVWISGANSGNSFEKLCISTKPLDGFEEYTDEAKRTLKESALPERVAQWEARISALENADEEESGDRAYSSCR